MDHVDVKWPDGEWRTALFASWEIRGAMNKSPELWVDGRLYDGAPWRVVNGDGSIMVVVDPAAGTFETPHGRTPRDVEEVALLLTDQMLAGVCFVDGRGRRVRPDRVQIREDGLPVHVRSGRRVWTPAPVRFGR